MNKHHEPSHHAHSKKELDDARVDDARVDDAHAEDVRADGTRADGTRADGTKEEKVKKTSDHIYCMAADLIEQASKRPRDIIENEIAMAVTNEAQGALIRAIIAHLDGAPMEPSVPKDRIYSESHNHNVEETAKLEEEKKTKLEEEKKLEQERKKEPVGVGD